MASSDLATIGYVLETAFGTMPATPAIKAIRYTGESVKFNITNTKTAELRPDRVESDLIQTSANVDGAINFELSYGTFADLIAAALCSTWTAGTGDQTVLINGNVRQGLTLQKHFPDMSVPEWHTYRGNVIEALDLKFEIGKIVTGSLTVMGCNLTQTEAQITGATAVAAGTNTPMNAVTDLQNFNIDAVPYSGCISTLGLNIKNNSRAIECLGTLGPKDIKLGTMEVTGDMNLFFNEGSTFGKFVAGTEFAFGFSMIDDDGNKYLVSVPRAKFESADVVSGGRNSDVMMNAKWRGLYDSVTGHVIQIIADPA